MGMLLAALVAAAPAVAASDPLRPQQWGLDLIESDAAHSASTGAGATVAVVDSGAAFGHADLAGRLVAGHDFVDGDDKPDDGNGHGTHVTGIVAADAGNGVGVEGVAPSARVLVVRVLDNNGAGSDQDIADGIDYARTHGAEVINLSLGEDIPLSLLIGSATGDAIDRAVAAGIVVVAAAGNSSFPFCDQPSSGAGGFLCVGAVDRDRTKSSYSNYGQGLAVVAPGGDGCGTPSCDILSTWFDGAYAALAGTSMAAPHVSGVAALLVACGVRGQAAVQRIVDTATDLGPPGPDGDYGAGLVNARAAVAGLSCPHAGGTDPSAAGAPAPPRATRRPPPATAPRGSRWRAARASQASCATACACAAPRRAGGAAR